MIRYILVFLFTFFVTALVAYGEDNRERRTRVALALAAPKDVAVVEIAPEPKDKKWPDYAEGYSKAVTTESVLVVYIGCEGSHPINSLPNCVVAVQKELPTFAKGSILIAYPVGKQLLQHKVMKCADYEAVEAETLLAFKKVDRVLTSDSPISKPLNWSLIGAETTADCCSYCKDCQCPDKNRCKLNLCIAATDKEQKCKECCKDCSCDGSCCKKKEQPQPKVETKPEVTAPVVTNQPPQVAGYTLWKATNGTYFYLPVGQSPCPNGRCPLPK